MPSCLFCGMGNIEIMSHLRQSRADASSTSEPQIVVHRHNFKCCSCWRVAQTGISGSAGLTRDYGDVCGVLVLSVAIFVVERESWIRYWASSFQGLAPGLIRKMTQGGKLSYSFLQVIFKE